MLNECSTETLEQHIDSCDLCLMYDSPTTASINFLKQSIPVLNIVDEPFTTEEKMITNANLIPQESVEEILVRLDRFKSDPVNFFSFRNTQFHDYIQLFQNAKPLRTFL